MRPASPFPQGPASWLDTNLTNPEMINFIPNAGAGHEDHREVQIEGVLLR